MKRLKVILDYLGDALAVAGLFGLLWAGLLIGHALGLN